MNDNNELSYNDNIKKLYYNINYNINNKLVNNNEINFIIKEFNSTNNNFIISNKTIKIIKKVYQVKDFSKNLNIPDNTDLVPGKYEGGIKLWECSIDLFEFSIQYLIDNLLIKDSYININNIEKLNVLELGCGHGLPGLQLYILKANLVVFQDYNLEVLNYITKEYINDINENENSANNNSNNNKYLLISGDWKYTVKNINNKIKKDIKFDLILSADTLYNVEYYSRLHNTIADSLSDKGVCLIASKRFYFGVGGGTTDFLEFIQKENKLSFKILKEIQNGFSNIREIIELRLKQQ